MVLYSHLLKNFPHFVIHTVKCFGIVNKAEVDFGGGILIYFPEKIMAPHFSTLAWKTPWTEEPGGLPSIGSHRVRHD